MPDFETVTLDTDFTVYAGVDTATTYADGAVHADTFRELLNSDEDKAIRNLITSTRVLDRQNWLGDKVDEDQPHAWPRKNTGITGLDESGFPVAVQEASIELAIVLADGSEVQNEQNTSQKIQSLSAGPVSLSFFRGAEGQPIRFPLIVQELLGPYLAGNQLAVTGVATGTDAESVTATDFGYTRGV